MKNDDILSRLTPEEKIALCSGKDFWHTKDLPQCGLPAMTVCDGPHGLRKQEETADMLGVNCSRRATCFPAEVTAASSWDTELLFRIGSAIAEEAADQQVGMVLGPGANLKRNPLCGRNFEYLSEDPYLTGKLAAAWIRGVEERNVCTSIKHFACNSQERDRFVSNSIIDERTLRENYLTGFEIAVKEGRPSSVMCAYPKLNGEHMSDNRHLLTDILRGEWGFDGIVLTDWGAMNDRIKAFRAGCDLNMPGGAAYMEKEAAAAVQNGTLSEEDIDRSAERVIKLLNKGNAKKSKAPCDYEAHHSLCAQAAAEGAVLLQNRDTLLPLREDARIAVISSMACGMRYQGAGSSHINPTKLSQPLSCLRSAVYAQGCDENGNTTEELLREARSAAESADAVIVFAGLPDKYESEGFDRADMKLPMGHCQMIEAAAQANPNTAVVLLCGSAVECPWADNVKSILYMGLPGQAGGEAIADLLYGRKVPSGRLAESWPFRYEDVPSSEIYGKTRDALYEEGIYVGYRYYDKACLPVCWPFGWGLSYTSFVYSELSVQGMSVSVSVKNTGAYDGAEVVQLYVCPPQNGIHRPKRELRRFTKVFLKKGESRRITFDLDDRCFALWQGGWKVPDGDYEICIGTLSKTVRISGETQPVPEWQKGSFYESCAGKPVRSQWETMLGRSYDLTHKTVRGSYTMENSVEEMKAHSLIMKIMYFFVCRLLLRGCPGRDPASPEYRLLLNSSVRAPLRCMYISSGMPGGVFPGLLDMANGHPLRGIMRMVKG